MPDRFVSTGGSLGHQRPIAKTVFPNPGRTDDGVSPPREPADPPRLSVRPRTEFVFATVGGTITLPAVAIGKVTGGTPVVVETNIDGRVAGTSMGDVARRQLVLSCGLYGRLDGRSVEDEVRALFKAAAAGRLARVYGPLDRPDCEGVAWSLGEPVFEDSGMRADRRLNHAKLTLTLGEWTPLVNIKQRKVGSAAKTVRARIASDEAALREQAAANRALAGLS